MVVGRQRLWNPKPKQNIFIRSLAWFSIWVCVKCSWDVYTFTQTFPFSHIEHGRVHPRIKLFDYLNKNPNLVHYSWLVSFTKLLVRFCVSFFLLIVSVWLDNIYGLYQSLQLYGLFFKITPNNVQDLSNQNLFSY